MRLPLLLPFVLSTVISVQAFAQAPLDYTLQQISNSDFVHVTLAHIVAKVGNQAQYLSSYECDGVTENQIFSAYAFSNVNGDSLKLKAPASQGGEIYTYKAGVFYAADGSTVSHLSGEFLSAVETALVKLETLPSGKMLLAGLEHSPYPLSIVSGQNRFSPTGPNGTGYGGIFQASTVMYFQTLFYPESYNMLNQIGNGGNINFDPNGNYSRIESDNVLRSTPAYIALAHEAYHAYDSVRGLLDRRAVVGTNYENTEACEYRAVYFENQARKEAGLKYSKYYGTTDVTVATGTSTTPPAPSMLSPTTGLPYAIPASCLVASDVNAVLHP
jgi:hypothetical protein